MHGEARWLLLDDDSRPSLTASQPTSTAQRAVAWVYPLQVAYALYLGDILLAGDLNRRFGFPVGSIIYDAALTLLVCSFLGLAGLWRTAGFRRPASWRSLLWFAPLLLPGLYSLWRPLESGLVDTLPFALLYGLQAIQGETIFNGLLVGHLQERGRWRTAVVVALVQGGMLAATFALVPAEEGFLPLLVFQFGSAAAIAFAHAALRIRTGLVWPLIIADVVGGIAYYRFSARRPLGFSQGMNGVLALPLLVLVRE